MNKTKCPIETCTAITSNLTNIGESVIHTMQKMKQKCDDTACKSNEMKIAEVQVSKIKNIKILKMPKIQ